MIAEFASRIKLLILCVPSCCSEMRNLLNFSFVIFQDLVDPTPFAANQSQENAQFSWSRFSKSLPTAVFPRVSYSQIDGNWFKVLASNTV